MAQINISYYNKYEMELILGSYQEKLCLLGFMGSKKRVQQDKKIQKLLNAKFVECEDEVLLQTAKELDEYFLQKRTTFTISLLLVGTEFQKKVWEALGKIPYGETITYKQQAKMIENEKAVRAVANANGANPISIILPCHRIIGSNGSLTGFGGGIELKKRLLEIEKGE